MTWQVILVPLARFCSSYDAKARVPQDIIGEMLYTRQVVHSEFTGFTWPSVFALPTVIVSHSLQPRSSWGYVTIT
jgi:hypothetical protein